MSLEVSVTKVYYLTIEPVVLTANFQTDITRAHLVIWMQDVS